MATNSNNADIETGQGSYHHGNLRVALVAAGFEALKEKDSDEFSLRAISRKVGVSATSVYRHFPDKQAFAEALCKEGSQMLALAQRKAMASTTGGQEGVDASGLAYVRFAVDNPRLFRLMSTSNDSESGLGGAEDPAMQELMYNLSTFMPDSTSAQQMRNRALHAWAVVHGISMLVLEGRLPDDEELIKTLIKNPTN